MITEEIGGLDEGCVWNVRGLEFPKGLGRHFGRFGIMSGSFGSVKLDSRIKSHPSRLQPGASHFRGDASTAILKWFCRQHWSSLGMTDCVPRLRWEAAGILGGRNFFFSILKHGLVRRLIVETVVPARV